MDERDEPSDAAGELIQGGSEIAGAAVGGALGLIGGPPGVVGGAAAGVVVTRVLRRVGDEIHRRVLGPRQATRMGAALAFAADDIRARLEGGETERDDGWFDRDSAGRPEAEELLEGVLLNAADAYEERKVKHLGWLYASVAFDPMIGRGYANFLLHLSERLTYRQLVCLALFASEGYRQRLVPLEAGWAAGELGPSDGLAAELAELGQAGLMGWSGPRQEGPVATLPLTARAGGGAFVGIGLDGLLPTGVGADLARLMRLDRVPLADIEEVVAELGVARV